MNFDINNIEQTVKYSRFNKEIMSLMNKYPELNYETLKNLIKNLRIYCDYDEILAKIIGDWLKFINKNIGTNFTSEDVTDFHWFGRQKSGNDFLAQTDMYKTIKPNPNALEFLKILKVNNLLHNFFVLTASPTPTVMSKKEHVERYFKEFFEYDKVVTIKHKWLMNYNNAVLIDDGAHNAQETVDKNPYARVVVLNYKHNEDLYTGKRIMRINDLMEFFDYLPLIALQNYDRFFDPKQQHLKKESFLQNS